MSFTNGSAILFTIVVTIVFFLIGKIFFGKLKFIRYIIWTLTGVFLFGSILAQISHHFSNTKWSKRFTGKYELDAQKSIYDSLVLDKFKNLVLNVMVDQTFQLNRETPFFSSTGGKWEYEDDGDMAWIDYSFNNSSNTEQMVPSDSEWVFGSWQMINGKDGERIVFVKSR
jgi:hypothetical protein